MPYPQSFCPDAQARFPFSFVAMEEMTAEWRTISTHFLLRIVGFHYELPLSLS